jgi:hypothetical protein
VHRGVHNQIRAAVLPPRLVDGALLGSAARRFYAREGHLRVPRQHREDVDDELLGLGSFISNARRRAAKLSPERRKALNALVMRW